jgi:hypothetical protein
MFDISICSCSFSFYGLGVIQRASRLLPVVYNIAGEILRAIDFQHVAEKSKNKKSCKDVCKIDIKSIALAV